MKKSDIIRLQHMLDAAREIRSYTNKHSREEVEKEWILILGLVKAVENIGEAASNVSPEVRAEIPTIDWDRIIGMRHRLVHAYFNIDKDILWRTIAYNIPGLIEELEAIPQIQ